MNKVYNNSKKNNNNSFKNKVNNQYASVYGSLFEKKDPIEEEINDLIDLFTAAISAYEEPKPSFCPFAPFGVCPFEKKEPELTEEEELLLLLDELLNGKKTYKPDYDFIDIFGKPVKVFNDFIQYGYDLIDIEDAYNILMNDYNRYSQKKKTTKTTIKVTLKKF